MPRTTTFIWLAVATAAVIAFAAMWTPTAMPTPAPNAPQEPRGKQLPALDAPPAADAPAAAQEPSAADAPPAIDRPPAAREPAPVVLAKTADARESPEEFPGPPPPVLVPADVLASTPTGPAPPVLPSDREVFTLTHAQATGVMAVLDHLVEHGKMPFPYV